MSPCTLRPVDAIDRLAEQPVCRLHGAYGKRRGGVSYFSCGCSSVYRPGRQRPAMASIAAIISRVMAVRALGASSAFTTACEAWESVAGKDLAERTRPVSLRNGTLMIEVRSAPLMAELRQFQATPLLRALQAHLAALQSAPEVLRLDFRV